MVKNLQSLKQQEIPVFSLLREAVKKNPNDSIRIEELVSGLGRSSFDLAIIAISVPMIIPMPPGIPAIAGFLIALFSFQSLRNRKHIWIPQSLKEKTIGKETLLKSYDKAEKYLGWIARYTRPRMDLFLSQGFIRLYLIIILLLGFIMTLPIPIVGNTLPAAVCVIMLIAKLRSDGLISLLSLFAAILVVAINSFVAFQTWNLLKFAVLNGSH
ncbi:MAG: exopolysaccharide biosynthesis protein [Hellea sp.]|nr:exopolysaccharide biosynthesis protein [Hellea sp.]